MASYNIDRLIEDALFEDLGPKDVTTDAIVRDDRRRKAYLLAKCDFVLAGISVFFSVFRKLSPDFVLSSEKNDGDMVNSGEKFATIFGPVSSILKGERVALNFLQRMCGIATLTKKFVEKARPFGVEIRDTRKTAPLLRVLEKYAVSVGGGKNHRFGLFDGILIKDNHIKVAGSIKEAISRVKETCPHTLKIEVEVSNLKEAKEAISSGCDIIMLDNMGISEMKEVIDLAREKGIKVEVSGGVSLKNIDEILKFKPDMVSIGAITHSFKSADISLEIE